MYFNGFFYLKEKQMKNRFWTGSLCNNFMELMTEALGFSNLSKNKKITENFTHEFIFR